MSDTQLYYIMSPYAPCGNSVLWWAEGGHGYTCDLNKAWKVTRVQADSILSDQRGDQALLVAEVDARAQSHFDMQALRELTGYKR